MKLVFFQHLLSRFKTDSCEPAVYTLILQHGVIAKAM